MSDCASKPDQLTSNAQALSVALVSSVSSGSASAGIGATASAAVGSTMSSLFDAGVGNSSSHSSSISAGINNLGSALHVGVAPGEAAATVSTANVQLSSEINYGEHLGGKSLQPPGCTSGMTLPPDGLSSLYSVGDSDAVSTSVVGLPNVHGSNVSANSSTPAGNTLRLNLGSSGSSSKCRRLAAAKDGEGPDGDWWDDHKLVFTPLEPLPLPPRLLSAAPGGPPPTGPPPSYITVVMTTTKPLNVSVRRYWHQPHGKVLPLVFSDVKADSPSLNPVRKVAKNRRMMARVVPVRL